MLPHRSSVSEITNGRRTATPSPGGVLPQGIKIAMISGGDHTTIYRWPGEAGSDEERRYLTDGMQHGQRQKSQIVRSGWLLPATNVVPFLFSQLR